MKYRIGRKLVGLALAASMLLPAPLAIAGAGDRQGDSINAPEVIRVDGSYGYRYWRDGDRHDRYRDDRRDRHRDDRYSRRDDRRRYDDRHGYRRHDDRHDHRRYSDNHRHEHRRDHRHRDKKRLGHDAAPFIFGGIALGTILLLNAIENDRRRR